MRLTLFFATVFLAGCSHGGKLKGGYRLEEFRAGYRAIVKDDHGISSEVVPGDILFTGVEGDVIYGFIKSRRYADGFKSAEGFFILNSRTGATEVGLSAKELSTRYGIIVKPDGNIAK